MLTWAIASDVFQIGSSTRRFFNPFAAAPPVPFAAYLTEPTGARIDPPEAPPQLIGMPAGAGLENLNGEPDAITALIGRPTGAVEAVPEFSAYGERSVVRVRAAGSTDRYGLGEVCGTLAHENRRITGWTRDSFAYDDRSDRLYQAHPWVLCVRPDGTAFGVIVETTYRYTAHLFDHLLIEIEGPPPAVTVIEGVDPAAVLVELATLVGRMPMPPRWALGYQQSKWNYAPQANVVAIAQEFRDRKLPADVIWVDIDYMQRYKVFTFDPVGFPDPAGLIDDLHSIGWRSAWMIDPGIKIEPGYEVYDSAIAGDHVLREADGTTFEGVVWPGPVVYPDFTRAETRAWWADLYHDYLAHGLDAVWNDMNEPASLEDSPDKALPPSVHHRADPEFGGPDSHERYRNLYGLLMTQASRDGMLAARPDHRPFLLTRSTFLGGHRYAATWTGDNVSNWDHLAWSIPMALNLGLSGQPLVGPDIGGFAGACTGELLARWMGIGCLFPFARNHSIKQAPPQEPWQFGVAVEATCRRALERRYRLLPYLYTVTQEAATTGLPIMRPAFFADPTDPALRTIDTAFLLGADLYVRCDVTPTRSGATAPVPVGWRRIEVLDANPADPLSANDPDLPELYLRPGAALPLGPVVQYSDEVELDSVTLVVNPDHNGQAVARLYTDAGDGFGYQADDYALVEYTVTTTGTTTGTEVTTTTLSGHRRVLPATVR